MKPARETIKLYLAAALMVIAISMIVRVYRSGGHSAQQSPAAALSGREAAAAVQLQDPRLHLDILQSAEAVTYSGAGNNIFRERGDAEIPPVKVSPLLHKPKAAQPAQNTPPPGPPPPPPINLVFFGYSTRKGERPRVFLSQGDNIWIAHEGDVVDRHYKILRVTPNEIEVEDLLTNNRQSIRLKQG